MNSALSGSTPVALFTFSNLNAPRLGTARLGTADEAHAHTSRVWLSELLIGKTVKFDCHRSAQDRYYGCLYAQPRAPQEKPVNVAVESVSLGHATVKTFKASGGNAAQPEEDFVAELEAAQVAAKAAALGLWSGAGLVRQQKQAGEQFNVSELVSWAGGRRIPVMIEHCFDGTRYRCSVLEDGPYAHASFTLQLAGVQSPRVADAYGGHAKHFVDLRILNRQLAVTFISELPSTSQVRAERAGCMGRRCPRAAVHRHFMPFLTPRTSPPLVSSLRSSLVARIARRLQPPAVAILHHPKGNIGVELLKSGLAMVSERTARMLGPSDVVAYRQAEAAAKGQKVNMWKTYVKPTIEGVAEANGTVVEVVTGDTLLILLAGVKYDGDDKLFKVSLASIRSPRLGNEVRVREE